MLKPNRGVCIFLFLIICACVSPAWAIEDVHQKNSLQELIETKRSALAAFEAKKYEEAERGFFHMVAIDPKGVSASLATDYLKKILFDSGIVKSAQEEYEKLDSNKKAKPTFQWNPKRLDAYEKLKLPGKLELHLFSMLKLGGVLAARTSFLSIIFDGMGLPGPAEYFFEKAQKISEKAQDEAYRELRARLMSRPLRYEFSPVMSRVGFFVYRPEQLQTVPFEIQQKNDPEIEVKKVPNLPGFHLNFGFLTGYDSNIPKKSKDSIVADGVARETGGSRHYLANIGVETDPTEQMTYGADYFLLLKRFTRDDLNPFETTTHVPSGWVSWWDRMNTEVRVRGEFFLVRHGMPNQEVSSQSFGPTLLWGQLWSQQFRTDFTYQYLKHHEKDDPAEGSGEIRSGTEHLAGIHFSYPGKKSRAHPFFYYQYQRNLAVGWAYNQYVHRLEVGTDYLIGKSAVLKFATFFERSGFPFYEKVRSDQRKGFALKGIYPLFEERFAMVAEGLLEQQNSDISSFDYSRYVIEAGFSVNL